MDERDTLLKISIVEKMTDKETFEDLYKNEPFLCDLLLENFISFFDDTNFTKLERQITLLKFLKNNYPIEVVRRVLSQIKKSDFFEDYSKIIMEWNYEFSDYIKQNALSKYDGELLAMDKKTKQNYDYTQILNKRKLNIMDNITKLLIDNNDKEV